MATTQHDGLLTYKDEAGNLKIMYPATRGENVLMESGDTVEETVSGHVGNQVVHVTASERTAWNGKAPQNHASSNPTYGVGANNTYGHVKLANNLTTENTVTGTALDARQGKALSDDIKEADGYVYTISDRSKAYNRWPAYAYTNGSTVPLNEVIADIQNGMNNLGGTIFLKPGSYNVSAPVTLKPRVRIVGCGTGVCITRMFTDMDDDMGAGKPLFLLNDECGLENIRFWSGSIPDDEFYPIVGTPTLTTPVKDVVLKNLEIESLYDGSSMRSDGLLYGSLQDSYIENCNFKRCMYGVMLSKSSRVRIANCNFSYSDIGITVGGQSSEITIANNELSDCQSNSIYMTNTTDSLISGNMVSRCSGGGNPMEGAAICAGESANDITIENNVCCDCTGASISAYSGWHNVINGNFCARNKYGIYGGYQGVISSNYCLDNYYDGINAGARCTVSGNVCRVTDKAQVSSSHAGIALTNSQSQFISVTGNTVLFGDGATSDMLSTQYTIRLGAQAKNCVVTGNSIMGKDVTDENTDTANKNMKANNKWKGDQS